jgi:Bacteriophage lambda head decoration protein D
VATYDSFEFDYIPAYTKPTHEYGQELGTAPYASQFMAPVVRELLKSYAAFTQKGVTLAGGNGILPTGCVLAMQTSSQYYYPYNATASDGTQTALGVLRDARDTGTASGSGTGQTSTPCLGNLVYRGILDLTLVSGTDTTSLVSGGTGTGGGIGSGTTGVVTQLKARTDTVNGLFIF